MRRRRLALRQIAETTQDVSDIDEQDSDAQEQQPSADEPTFNLLTVTTGAGAASTTLLLSDDDLDDEELLQHERSARPSPIKNAAKKPQHAPNGGIDVEKTSGSSSIFHLYQEGLAPDQVLQLAFTRRRAPRSLRMKDKKPGDEFVLPLPALSIRDLLPRADVDIRDLFASDASLSALQTSSLSSPLAANQSTSEFGLSTSNDVLASANTFFFNPERASLEQRRSWQAISEGEWHQLYQELQKEHTTGNSKTTQPLITPSIDSVCVLLRDCHSDALARFIWETLLVPVLEAVSSVSQRHDRDYRVQELIKLLLRHKSLRAMAPKEFRKSVRAKRLREQLSDAAIGASVELQLLALYHSNRQHDWLAQQ